MPSPLKKKKKYKQMRETAPLWVVMAVEYQSVCVVKFGIAPLSKSTKRNKHQVNITVIQLRHSTQLDYDTTLGNRLGSDFVILYIYYFKINNII